MAPACHYCGRGYGRDGEAADAAALRRHLLADCPDVPARVRLRYERGCPSGRCGR